MFRKTIRMYKAFYASQLGLKNEKVYHLIKRTTYWFLFIPMYRSHVIIEYKFNS